MRVKVVTFQYTRPDIFRIYPIGDQHLGTLHCYEEGLKKKIKQIQDDPLAYWIDMGDSCEFITPHDPRWDSGALPDWLHPNNIASDQVDHYCELHGKIASKCLGKIKGNHEVSIEQHSDVDVQTNICKRMGIDNLDYSCLMKFVFKRAKSNCHYILVGLFTHGAGCAVTAGAKLTRLQRLMDNFDADIYAHAHIHDILTYEKPYLTLDNNNTIQKKVKVGAMTGCWFRTYTQNVSSSYGERKNYPPVSLGCPVFVIHPDKGLLKVENS
jgi:hypothetical protein